MTDIQYGGALDGIQESTRLVGETFDLSVIDKPFHTFKDKQRQINQTTKIGRNSCTLASAIGCVADNIGFERPEEDMPRLYKVAVEEGLDPSIGWYIHKAVDLVRRKLKEWYNIETSTTSVKIGSDNYKSLLSMGYSISTGYKGNRSYNQDKNDDGIVQVGGINSDRTYGHAIRHTTEEIIVVDNYLGSQYNIYDHDAVEGMIKAGRHFARGFIFFQKIEMPTNENLPEHNRGVTMHEKEIVRAWQIEVTEPAFKVYTDGHYLTRMLIDLNWVRQGKKKS